MKSTTSVLLFASSILSTAALAVSTSATYTLKIKTENPRLNGGTVVVKDESLGAAFPNPLGSFSTGEPRHAYTVTVSTVSASDMLYELKSATKQTHLIVNGDPIAPQLFEAYDIGGDPAPIVNKTVTRTKFIIWDDMTLWGAADKKNAAGSFHNSAGSWRACNGTTVDYQLYWYDGTNNLKAVAGICELVTLVLEEVKAGPSSTMLPVTTLVTSRYPTGVPAPTSRSISKATNTTSTTSGFITGVPAPTAIPQITIRIFNDQTGANAAASVPADGTSRNIADLFRGSAIDKNGDIIGTSALLVKFSDSTKCSLKNANVRDWNIELDGRAKNFADLDRDTSKAIPVWLNGFTFSCV